MASETLNAAYCRQQTSKINANIDTILKTKTIEMFFSLVDMSSIFLGIIAEHYFLGSKQPASIKKRVGGTAKQ